MGKLVVLSGLDGSGKGTQLNLIKKYFEDNNIKYVYLHFPMYDHNIYGKIIAAYLRGEYGDINEVDPIFVANIYAMDRFLYLPMLNKQLEENDVVLLDRYVFCNMAYQGAKHDTEIQSQIMRNWIDELEFGFLELPYPDLTVFFDVPIETIKARLEETREGDDRNYLNGKKDIHEANIEFQSKVRDNYLALKEYQNYIIIPCLNDTPEEIFEKYKIQLKRTLL